MRIRYSATLVTTGLLAFAGAAPAQAGLVDGSLNDAHVLDHGNVLGAMASAHVGDDRNNNANARAGVDIRNNGSIDLNADVSLDNRATAKPRRRPAQRAR
jgi:hypothetical protein